MIHCLGDWRPRGIPSRAPLLVLVIGMIGGAPDCREHVVDGRCRRTPIEIPPCGRVVTLVVHAQIKSHSLLQKTKDGLAGNGSGSGEREKKRGPPLGSRALRSCPTCVS